MITADDAVWDAYFKAHPYARAYRMKTLPNYNDLALSFGDIFDCKIRSHLDQDKDPDGGILVIKVPDIEKNSHLNTSIDPFGTDWTPAMDRYFIDLVMEQMNGGHKINQTFNEQSWAQMVEAFNAKFGLQCHKYVLETRHICLMRQHDGICNLLKHCGCVWDKSQQMVTGGDDVWEAYIKDYPYANSYRDKFLGNFGDLCKIFGNELLNGSLEGQDLGANIDHNASEMELEDISGDLDNQISYQHSKRRASMPLEPEY